VKARSRSRPRRQRPRRNRVPPRRQQTPRGLVEVTQDKIVDEAAASFDLPEIPTLPRFDEKADLITASRRLLDTLPKKAKSGLSEFIHIVETLRAMVGERPQTDATGANGAGSTVVGDESAAADSFPRDAKTSVATGPTGSANLIPQDELDSLAEQAAASGDSAKSKKRRKGAVGLASFVEKLVESSGLLAYHQGQDEIAGTQRVANLEELVNAASLYTLDRAGLVEFLEHIELDRAMADEDDNPDSVTLITVHKTKGLEFRRVIITGLESGVFPREDKKGDDLEESAASCTSAVPARWTNSTSRAAPRAASTAAPPSWNRVSSSPR
jgi:DNA helicase-2/ATP-dependent DNA helicase PcrA